MKIRIKFSKTGNMRFVGHLDLMRYFQRALLRAGFDLSYSEGFNPHPHMSFALPLGIGLTSEGEYMDVVVGTSGSSRESIGALNREMVEGVTVTGYVLLPDQCKSAMASVAAADYMVYFKDRDDFTKSLILSGIEPYYEGRDHISIIKKTKKAERILDIRPLIYRMDPLDRDGHKGFFLRLSAGSSENIRPELVLEDFYSFCGKNYDPSSLQIHRLELYENISTEGSEPQFVPLLAAGKEII